MLIEEASKYHRGEPVFEIKICDIENMDRESYRYETTKEVYFTMEEALKIARKIAEEESYMSQVPEEPDFILFVCIIYGRKYAKKNGYIYGSPKIVHIISTNTKEETDKANKDKRWKKYEVNEYTTPPVVTKEEFYQWPDKG